MIIHASFTSFTEDPVRTMKERKTEMITTEQKTKRKRTAKAPIFPLCVNCGGEQAEEGHVCPKPLVEPSLICVCGHRADAHAPFNSPEEPPQEYVACKCDQFVGEPPAVQMLRSMEAPKANESDRERLHEAALARWRRERPASTDAGESNGYHPQMLLMIPVGNIEPSPTNPRKYFDPDKLQELADSISEHGLVEPILVRPLSAPYDDDPLYQLVAGERRWRAAKLAGVKEIEAKVRGLDDRAVLEIQFIENLQRADLSAIEEAEGYKRLLDEHGYTAESLAGKLAKSKSYVYGRLKLCNLPLAALDALAKGDLPATIGELIGRLPSMEFREEFWQEHYGDLGKKWFEAPSFRQVKETIESEWMRELKSAPFSRNVAQLVPGVPACIHCPKRTGNDRVNYPDSRADICTDTDCYDEKVRAFNKRKLDEAVKDGVRALSPEESQEWFGHGYMIPSAKTRDYVDLNDECDQAADPDDWEKPTPTYAELLGDSVKTEIVGLDRAGQVHQLVSREAAENVLKEKGIKLASLAPTEADRKASQQEFKEQKQIRDQAANEICDRVVQSLTDKPLTLGGRSDSDDFLRAIALHLVGDADIARFVAKRHALGNDDHRAALHKIIENRSGQGTLELIVEYMLAEELEWWIRSGELPYLLERFPICEYFGHDPKKIEKRIAKEHAAAKKAKAKPKAKAAIGA